MGGYKSLLGEIDFCSLPFKNKFHEWYLFVAPLKDPRRAKSYFVAPSLKQNLTNGIFLTAIEQIRKSTMRKSANRLPRPGDRKSTLTSTRRKNNKKEIANRLL